MKIFHKGSYFVQQLLDHWPWSFMKKLVCLDSWSVISILIEFPQDMTSKELVPTFHITNLFIYARTFGTQISCICTLCSHIIVQRIMDGFKLGISDLELHTLSLGHFLPLKTQCMYKYSIWGKKLDLKEILLIHSVNLWTSYKNTLESFTMILL